MPMPSPSKVPSAPSENGRQSPVGDSAGVLLEADVHEDVVHGVGPASDDEIRMTHVQVRPWPSPEPTDCWRRAASVTAVGAAQVEPVGNATSHHVAQDSGKELSCHST